MPPSARFRTSIVALLGRARLGRSVPPVLLFVLLVIGFGLAQPRFVALHNIETMLRAASTTGLAALGLTFVIIVSRFDMSFPWVAALAAMTTGFLVSAEYSFPICLAAGLGIGLVWGIVNGIAIGLFGLPDIICTIATGSIAFGLAYLYSNGVSIYDNFITSGMLGLNNNALLGIELPIWFLFGLYAIAAFGLERTSYGRAFYATGENRVSAIYSGIRVRRYVIAAFALCTTLSAWAAILMSASGGQADVRTGLNFLMPAYASVYLGASLFGRPSAGATLFASVFLSALLNGFMLLGVAFYYSDAITSVILVLALLASNPRIKHIVGAWAPRYRRRAAGSHVRAETLS